MHLRFTPRMFNVRVNDEVDIVRASDFNTFSRFLIRFLIHTTRLISRLNNNIYVQHLSLQLSVTTRRADDLHSDRIGCCILIEEENERGKERR